MKIRAVIIDDISLARASLRADLEDYCPQVEIIGEADGVLSGLKLIRKESPELIFLDIHMTDGEGFDVLEILQNRNASVIFTTASEAHAIKAFQNDALDYLLKPIDPDLLEKAVQKHIVRKAAISSASISKTVSKVRKHKITLSTLDDLRVVDVADIVRLQADGNYTTVYELDGTKTMISKSLKEFELQLVPYNFYRTHQSHLVSVNKIKSYLKSEGGFLLMEDGSEVPVSVRKKAEVVAMLKNS